MSARLDPSAPRISPALSAAVYAASLLLCGAGSLLFVQDPLVALVLCLPLALLPRRSALAMLAARRTRAARVQLQMLLQHLCAALTSGRSPETALAEALPAMARFFGPSAGFCRALRTAVLALQAGRPFADAVRALPAALPCPESAPIFQAIPVGRILGPRVLDLLRASLAMTTERLLLEQEAAAQSSSRRVEALALSATPFLVALSLRGAASGFFEPAFTDPRGRFALAAVFAVSVAAASLALHIVSDPSHGRAPRRGTHGTSRVRRLRVRAAVSGSDGASSAPSSLARLLPAVYVRHLLLVFSRSAEDPEEALARHLAAKPLRVAAGAAAFALPVGFAGGPPILILAAALAGALLLSTLHDRDARAVQIERDRGRIQAYPTFLGFVVALLSAGLVPLRALEVARLGLSDADGSVAADLDRTLGRIRGGRTLADALDRLALECGVPEIASALSLLAQYDRRGGPPTLELLRLQASSCWALARAETRRRLDETSTRLLLPTALDLIAVLALTGIPALLSFQPAA